MNGPSPSLPLEHRRLASRLALELHALLRESEAKPPVVRAVIRELAYLAGCEALLSRDTPPEVIELRGDGEEGAR